MQQVVRRHLGRRDAKHRAHLGRERNRLGGAREHPAARADQRLVIVGPARARQIEHALALGKARGGIGRWVQEDMPMVERRQQADMAREQHAVAEHVARHVADADHGEVGGLRIHAHLAEMPLDRFPRAARGDGHLLVVVADRTAGGEGIAQPEAVFARDGVGVIRERGRALVGGDHQVRVITVVAHHVARRHEAALDVVVGQVEQPAQEGLVARHAFSQIGIAIARRRRLLDDEAALGADRHDDSVLDHLRLDQAEHLGAEILAPVRPAQPAARDLAAAQVHALDPR